MCVPCEAHGGGVMVAENCSVGGGGGAAVDREEVNDGEKQKEDRDWLHGARVPRAGP